MRPTARFFATVKSASKYLEANTPTGLTGLQTHPAPRPALLYTYKQTLKRLKQIPPSSVYRQSVEALTKHRMKIVEETKPEGYEEWLERVRKTIEGSPKAYEAFKDPETGGFSSEKLYIEQPDPWDGDLTRKDARSEGANSLSEAQKKAEMIRDEGAEHDRVDKEGEKVDLYSLEQEPSLTADQISSIEEKIGAGLIEEVVQVAEGELELVTEMLQSQVWEPLEEQTPSGQWEYFERGDRV